MASHGPSFWRLTFCGVLVALVAGCQALSTPSAGAGPPGAAPGGYSAGPAAGTAASAPGPAEGAANSTRTYDPAVKKASAAQPLPSPDDTAAGDSSSLVYLADYDEDDSDRHEKKPEGFWDQFSPEVVGRNVKEAFGYGPDKKLARQYFDEGLALYKQRQFEEAAAKFKAAAGRWPDSPLEEDALFMRAESLFFSDKYGKSHDTFANLLKKYDNSRHLDKIAQREFAIGRYWDQLHQYSPHWPITYNWWDSTRPRFDTLGNARKAYETVILNDPTGPLADDSLMALGNSYFRQERYQDAADYYDRLRKEQPNSTHLINAYLLGIKSRELLYQGPLYDSTPLVETGDLAEQAVRQFGTRLGAERERLIETQNHVDAEKANRDWAMAKFYEGKRQYGAARFYYKQILKEHPQLEIAQRAQQRIEEITSYPDKPANHFKFLTDLFPDNR
jgi:tetratricopeptide (TPR) repeat protein